MLTSIAFALALFTFIATVLHVYTQSVRKSVPMRHLWKLDRYQNFDMMVVGKGNG